MSGAAVRHTTRTSSQRNAYNIFRNLGLIGVGLLAIPVGTVDLF